MKLALRIAHTLSTHTNQSTTLNIKVASLIDKFEEELIKEADLYELPLSRQNSILAYTSRFAKSVINLENITAEKKKHHFKVIKQSMLRNNKFTPRSCIELCESLVHFRFEGDQSRILQMLRSYAAQSRLVFSLQQMDRFNMSYKYLMVDKLTGPIKFVNFELHQDNLDKSHMTNKMKYLLETNQIKIMNIKDWQTKREVQFEFKVGEKVRRIKLKAFKSNLKADQQELTAREISKLIQRDHQVMLVKNNNNRQYDISPQQLSKQLLVDSKNWHFLDQFPLQTAKDNSPFTNLVLTIRQKIKYQNEHLKIIEVTPMNCLNNILALQSEAALKQLFGYVKFNTFHTEIQKLLHLYGFEKRQHLKQMFPLSFARMLQIQQQNQFQFITPQLLAAKTMVDLIVRTDTKTFNLFLDEESIYEYLYFFINYAKSKNKAQHLDQSENRDLKIVKKKLALASILYSFNLNMPILESNISILRKTMFPLTFQYRYPKPQ